MKVVTATVAAIAALGLSTPVHATSGARHARLIATGFAPFKVKGTGFHARERVRLTVSPTMSERIVRRVRASRAGTFAVSFPGVESCAGVSGVATGNRGSHASFQFSSLVCP